MPRHFCAWSALLTSFTHDDCSSSENLLTFLSHKIRTALRYSSLRPEDHRYQSWEYFVSSYGVQSTHSTHSTTHQGLACDVIRAIVMLVVPRQSLVLYGVLRSRLRSSLFPAKIIQLPDRCWVLSGCNAAQHSQLSRIGPDLVSLPGSPPGVPGHIFRYCNQAQQLHLPRKDISDCQPCFQYPSRPAISFLSPPNGVPGQLSTQYQ